MFIKRIVVCADGTWNIRDQVDSGTGKRRPTNVTKVARAVLTHAADGTDQIVFYHDGLGTRGGLDKYTGGAFGRGIESTIRELYRFLVYNYELGDELFFFGFSRGAFTVRTLAGFMKKFGLVQKSDDFYVPEIYGCYKGGKASGSPEWVHAFHNVRVPRPCPPIKFIGVWDTVGALGAPGFLGQIFSGNKYRYHDVALNPYIEHAYHALAIDERRKAFAPDLWSRPPSWQGTLEQAWFPGAHSNIGGGYAPDGLANEALHWIVEKAEALGLEFNNSFLAHYLPCFNSLMKDSRKGLYRLLKPHERAIDGNSARAETIHQSAIDRLLLPACNYEPSHLKAYLAKTDLVTASTTRIARGAPCIDPFRAENSNFDRNPGKSMVGKSR